MKNTLILILVFSIVFSGIIPLKAYGQTVNEENLESIILKLKELFGISNDYDNFVSRVNSYDNQVNYYLSWSDSEEKLPNLNINVDSDGNIISYDKYYNKTTETESKLPKISKDEALKSALNFIEMVDSKVFKEIELKESSHPRSTRDRYYSFRFIRNIKNIPYNSNTVNISIDMQTGEVSSLYINWDRDIEFPDANNIISLDEAREAYKEKIGLKLVYKQNNRVRIMDNEQENRYFLAYSTLGEVRGIDAFTGESINLSYYSIFDQNRNKEEDGVSGAGEAPIITPEEREEIDKLKDLKSIEEAEKEARDILDLDNEYELKRTNLYSSWENIDEFFYSLSFVKVIDEREYYTEISLNAKTLDLKSFYKYTDVDAKAKPAINKAQALELAKDYITQINPDKVDEVEFLGMYRMEDNQQYYGFNFIRKIDGIYVESDGISIGIDAVNKEVNSYNINWYNGKLPAKENIIHIDKAYDVLFSEIGFDLIYNDIYNYETTNIDNNREIRLVYSVNQDKPTIVDAFTGDILNYAGNVYKDSSIPTYTDIDNSYAKNKINTLAEYGIGFSGGNFNPKELIKQKDFLLLLWQSMNPYKALSETDIDEIYQNLIRQNIVKEDEENRERAVNKEEAVKFVIRAMNYEKLAEIPNIYRDIFTDGEDLDPNLKGHMTLAYGLRIINGDGTKLIRPKYELKREDASSIIYNYMFN